MILLPRLLVNNGLSIWGHLAHKRLGWRLLLVLVQRHVLPVIIVPLHEQIYEITLAHQYCLKLGQLAPDLPVQPLQLAVGLRVLNARQNLVDSQPDQPLLEIRRSLPLCL